MNEHNINILERLHAAYYQLSAAERKVADFVLSQYSQVQFMSITQLAEECAWRKPPSPGSAAPWH